MKFILNAYFMDGRGKSTVAFMLGICTALLWTRMYRRNVEVDDKSELFWIHTENCKKTNPEESSTQISGSERIYEVDWKKADAIKNSIRILCYINTIPKTHYLRATHIKEVWAKQCTDYLFMSSAYDKDLPTVNLNLSVPESRMHLWSKMRAILRYVYRFRDDYDYFLKADDDTFVLLENLRYALLNYNPDEPIMAGYPFKHILPESHMSGGAGYVLSRGALKVLVEKAIDRHPGCPMYDQDLEDVKVSQCAHVVGVKLEHVVDRHTTIPHFKDEEICNFYCNEYRFQWENFDVLFSRLRDYNQGIAPHRFNATNPFVRQTLDLLSVSLVSAHYMFPERLYMVKFLIYYLRPAGIVYSF
ncbi:unnamed protein product [Calicophoron daubneyi]|uniref:N-acetylgalactosaminide beta-1,3-galactosyltransferase n=1 Tax=Calicophoron daubneyi TaxID=300641 RepID=A0AAV2TKM0_CALDB